MTWQQAGRWQIWVLVVISAVLLWTAPDHWRLTPDGGIYVGTAEQMLAQGAYVFNGNPNLLYYPGVSSIIASVMAVAGSSALIVHTVFTAIVVAALWLARAYFTASRYGWIGIAMPVVLICAATLQIQAFRVLSDALFLGISLAALLCWRGHAEEGGRRWFWACAVLVAVSPMVRFQGLFLIAAFGLALLWDWIGRRPLDWGSFARLALLGVIICAPFALWTWRNYVLYTPDTPNMVLSQFFGLRGLGTYGEGFSRVDWIDAEWKYVVYRYLFALEGITRSLLGTKVLGMLPQFLPGLAFAGLCLLGLRRYLRGLSQMELLYVGLSLGYLIYERASARHLYTVDRYWLPMLPFLLCMVGFGLASLRQAVPRLQSGKIVAAGAAVLALLVLVNGGQNLAGHADPDAAQRDRETARIYEELNRALAASVPRDDVLLASDRGIVPWVTGRRTLSIPAAPVHRPTFKRIARYGMTHLVMIDRTSHNKINTGKAMVAAFPDLFTLVKRIERGDDGPWAVIYRIDLAGVERTLATRQEDF